MEGRNPVIGGGGFHHVAIMVRDFPGSVTFYTDVLGFREKASWTMEDGRPATILDTGDGNYLEIFGDPTYQSAPNGAIVHFALRTRDVDAATERCRAAGCKVTLEPTDLGPKVAIPKPARIAFIEAPEGVVIEFFQSERT